MLKPTVFVARQHAAFFAILVAACAPYPQRVKEAPVLVNGDRVPTADGAAAAGAVAAERGAQRSTADSIHALAVSECSPAICSAVARGEIALGMSETQVYAATRSTPEAWVVRHTGADAVMVPATRSAAPSDRNGELVMVQLASGRSAVVSRRGPQGIIVVSRPQDMGAAAQSKAAADALMREGDELVAANDLDGALNRYDRASVLDPEAADPQYKAARLLDLQLRPQEALMRYQRFLLSLEIERIQAKGDANAKLAEAIALAQQRIVVLEKQVR
ncbi:MAG: tetratricopeptide repeat protein [Gemmatimonadaceae bacterium]